MPYTIKITYYDGRPTEYLTLITMKTQKALIEKVKELKIKLHTQVDKLEL
jgi:hypothetical protein